VKSRRCPTKTSGDQDDPAPPSIPAAVDHPALVAYVIAVAQHRRLAERIALPPPAAEPRRFDTILPDGRRVPYRTTAAKRFKTAKPS
jgi:hypothetical protein